MPRPTGRSAGWCAGSTIWRSAQILIADKNYYGREFEATLPGWASPCAQPARANPSGQRTIAGVLVRVWQRLLALTAVIWHNDTIGATIKLSLIAYGH